MATATCPRWILLIEDDPALRAEIAALLDGHGYTTVSVGEFQRAVDLLRRVDIARPCLVLADLITVPVDLATLLNALEPDDQLATLPMALVCVNAPGQPAARVKKPIDFDLLMRIVREHCCTGDRQGGTTGGGRNSAAGHEI